ncbi:MAG: FtsW/RodA/SpoVE family cell cycle protein [Niabella sp.]
MATKTSFTRNVERLLLACATTVLLVMALVYFLNIKNDLEATEEGYAKGTVVNLCHPVNKDALKKVLTNGGYFTDAVYVDFIASQLQKQVSEKKVLPNLGSLNKSAYWIDAKLFKSSGSEAGRLRFLNSLAHLGMDSVLYAQENVTPRNYPSEVTVQTEKTGISISGKIEGNRLNSRQGILVRLNEILPSNYFDTLQGNTQQFETEFFARTDADGHYAFHNLKKNSNYSVLPVKPGFEFGRAKGKVAIKGNESFDFSAKPHQLRILDATEYRQIKNDNILTVRTLQEFLKSFVWNVTIFLLAFWLLHIVLSIRNYRSDQFILPLLMFISGIGVMVLYTVQDPLQGEIYGAGMARYASVVLVVFAVIAYIFKNNPINRFYHSRWFDPIYKYLPGANPLKSPRGYTWLFASILLMILLLLFGAGPEGSGVKVNLFGFQVSELSKFLMVVFFAAYFSVNTGYFRNIPDNRWLTKNNLLMLGLFVFLLLVYAALGDLGPAIVLCLTFLFFYAFAKAEFLAMVLSGLGFGLLLFILSKIGEKYDANYLPWFAAACSIGIFIYAYAKRKYESVFFIILLISSFVLLAVLPFDFTQRLADRNSMYGNIWDNEFIGGDQLAQGIWSLNSGGFLGQGLGKGFSNVMPAYHTDMIVQSIGEELGMVGLIAIFLAFGLLFYRCILAARRTGKPFMFYLMSGIAIATMLQFIVIVAGTLDLIPLTGISVPFLSKGNAGIIVTLFAFLLVLLMSGEKGDVLEMEYIKKHFDNVNASVILTFFAVIIVFTSTLFWYQYKSDEYIVKPALVLNRQGEWQYTYNPRIALLMREIKPGNIYDRNGVLLATSDKEKLLSDKAKLIQSGADAAWYNLQAGRELKRYYPFGSDLLFWLGDFNKEIAREESNGYAAEYRHYTMLRGFDVTYSTSERTSSRYKESRFLPETDKQTELVLYDYKQIAPFIKAGKNSVLIDEQNRKPKDIRLSIDVAMTRQISKIIQQKENYKNFRTSVVVLQPNTGDVLVSASNPSPSFQDLKLISNIDPYEYRDIFKSLFDAKTVVPQDLGITFNSRPGSTIKIVDAFAAMNKFGTAAADFSYFIYPGEVIHKGEPENENVDMRKAIVRSSNVYFIKLVNEKNLQMPLFDLYDALGINIRNKGGYHFQKPADYDSLYYFKQWDEFLSKGKNIYNSKRLQGSRKRFASNYSNIAWGQGELMATPLQLARMSGTIANEGVFRPSRFLIRNASGDLPKPASVSLAKHNGMSRLLAGFMQEQSVSVSAATGLQVHGKTGSPERDKIIKKGESSVRKRVTDAWYTFYVPSPKNVAPLAFAIRIEEIGNSEYAKELAKDILKQMKSIGYF